MLSQRGQDYDTAVCVKKGNKRKDSWLVGWLVGGKRLEKKRHLVGWLVSNAVGVKKKRQLVGFPNISHHSTSSSPLNH